MNGNIIFILSDKGGVGKTTFAANYVATLRKEGDTIESFEVEVGKGAIHRYLDDVKHIEFNESSIREHDTSLDILLETAIEGKTVVVDTGANTGRGLAEWMLQVEFFDLAAENKVGVTFAVVTNSGDAEQVDYLKRLAALTENAPVTWVAIHAHLHGGDFSFLKDAETQLQAAVVEFEAIPERLMDRLKDGKTFTSIVDESDKVVERQRFKGLQNRFADALKGSPLELTNTV